MRGGRREFNPQLDGRPDERLRVARELHDMLLQSFQASVIQMKAARNILDRRPEKAGQSFENAISTGAGVVAEGRSAIQDLRLHPASRGDLAELLTAAGEELAHSRDEVYRIARELPRNAFRHAQAGRIEAEIRYESRRLRVHVRDDGKGIGLEILEACGRAVDWGLPGMWERANRSGGNLAFWSQSGAGIEVRRKKTA